MRKQKLIEELREKVNELRERFEKETGDRHSMVNAGSVPPVIWTNEYIAWLESQLTWRKVEEELPDKDGQYLVIAMRNSGIGKPIVATQIIINGKVQQFNKGTITHWLPIPELS